MPTQVSLPNTYSILKDNISQDDSELNLESYEDLGSNYSDNASDSLFSSDIATSLPGKRAEKTRPDFFSRSITAAERSAKRTQVNESESFLLIEEGTNGNSTSSRKPGISGRRNRGQTQGDRLPVFSKKITVELDSDDERMLEMREKGYTDGQVSEQLAKEGRVRYGRKSISTRIGRIKLAQAANVDFMLEQGYKEWTLDDDQRLMKAYDFANIEVKYEIERVRAWRFKKVAEYMRRLDKESIFSEKACRDRYQAIVNGTATIPIDEDDNPLARRADLEAFREQREKEREAERIEKERQTSIKRKIREESQLRQATKAEQTAKVREKKQETAAQRAIQRAANNQLKLQRAQENKIAKAKKLEQIHAEKNAKKAAAEKKIRDQNKNAVLKLNGIADLRSVKADTPDPRGFLSFEDLKNFCETRALGKACKSKEELVQRLRDADDVWTLAQLKTMCRTKGLNTAGSKMQLAYQLALAEAGKYASFEEGLEAAQKAGANVPIREESGEKDAGLVNDAPNYLMQGTEDEDVDME